MPRVDPLPTGAAAPRQNLPLHGAELSVPDTSASRHAHADAKQGHQQPHTHIPDAQALHKHAHHEHAHHHHAPHAHAHHDHAQPLAGSGHSGFSLLALSGGQRLLLVLPPLGLLWLLVNWAMGGG